LANLLKVRGLDFVGRLTRPAVVFTFGADQNASVDLDTVNRDPPWPGGLNGLRRSLIGLQFHFAGFV
jgi:hypothetical protein